MLPDALQNSGLSKRALNALMRGGIRSLEDAAEWSDRDLLSLPHFGPTSLAVLHRLIDQRNGTKTASAVTPFSAPSFRNQTSDQPAP